MESFPSHTHPFKDFQRGILARLPKSKGQRTLKWNFFYKQRIWGALKSKSQTRVWLW